MPTPDSQSKIIGNERNFLAETARYVFSLFLEVDGAVRTAEAELASLVPLSIDLVLNPQSITMDEPAAVVITPAQSGGTLVEHRGQIIKDIMITGTTGFLPPRKGKSPLSFLGPQSPLETVIQEAAKDSGFVAFHELRNLFRRYWDARRGHDDPSVRRNLRMVFFNTKDVDSWVVEPITFRMERSAPRNTFTYNYMISLRALQRYDDRPPGEDDEPKTLIELLRQKVGVVQNTVGIISANIAATRSIVEKDLNILTDFSVLFSSAVTTFNKALTTPFALGFSAFDKALTAVTNILGATVELGAIPTRMLESMIFLTESIHEIRSRFELFVLTFSQKWRDYMDRLSATERIHLLDPADANSFRVERVIAAETIQQAAQRLLGRADRFPELVIANNLLAPYFVDVVEKRKLGLLAPGEPILVPTRGNSDILREIVPQSLDSMREPARTTGVVTSATTTTLRDSAVFPKWIPKQWVGSTVEITVGTGIGQKKIITNSDEDSVTIDGTWSPVPDTTSTYKIYQERLVDTKEDERRHFGIDIKLTQDNDLAIGAGDYVLVTGMDNMKQATNIKLSTEQGALPMHPFFGVIQGIGTKLTRDSFVSLKLNAIRTFLSDARIDKVDSLSFNVVGDRLQITAGLRLKGEGITRIFEKKV